MIGDEPLLVGIGRTPSTRTSKFSITALAAQASRAAMADAGIHPSDVDAVCTYPGGSPSVHELREALGLRLNWFDGGSEGAAHLRPVIAAWMAVRSGVARCVLVVRAVDRLPGTWASAPAGGIRRDLELLEQARLPGAISLFAMWAQRLGRDHGLDRHHFGTVVLAARAAAAMNPHALLRDPLERETYAAEPPLAAPLTKLDCDRLCSGAVALIVRAAGDAPNRDRAIRVEAWAAPLREGGSLLHAPRQAMWACAEDLWSASALGPSDIDVWALYDGFSSLAAEWLAALGVARGAALRELLEDPASLGTNGPVPMNLDGGMLGGGRLHGLNYVHEACLQLRGEAQARQRHPTPRAAVVAVGGGPIAGAAVLTQFVGNARSHSA